jgi:uncharacterized protein with PIN domain
MYCNGKTCPVCKSKLVKHSKGFLGQKKDSKFFIVKLCKKCDVIWIRDMRWAK